MVAAQATFRAATVQPRGGVRKESIMNDRETPDGNADDFEREERERYEMRRARDAKVRQALDPILDSLKEGVVTPILGAMAALAVDQDTGEAFEMLVRAIAALVYRDPQACADVRDWYARQRGGDVSRRSISIVKLNDAVESAVYVIGLGDSQLLPNKILLLERLAEYLKRTFGPPASLGRMPSAADLEQLISNRGGNRRGKQVTNSGITAAIVHQGRLFGTSGQSLAKVRNRVDSALRRKRKAERALRERVGRG
jgi:hypothetical protein